MVVTMGFEAEENYAEANARDMGVEEMGVKEMAAMGLGTEEVAEEVFEEKFQDPVVNNVKWWDDLDVQVDNISRFDNWDHRESSVGNAQRWKDAIAEYLPNSGEIPKVIHQIWVGPKEPPCVWLDSWRVDYCFDNPHWGYKLWSDEEVASFDMISGDLYHQEKMWQCKADILRLEILYQYGGVYIDADMVSLRRNFDKVIDMADDTKFLIMYEPDTKDKPYSVIGNSLIATTPKHPLIKMLILYIRAIYHHKRPYHGVEWVTGPLAFTKCLVHANMPMSVPPTSYFYPQFHFVPNPDAIDLTMFPDSYGFQFGYTCSGLEGWVKANNKCKRALDCPVHKKRKQWPMGTLKAFPESDEGLVESGAIPKVIHQFTLQSDDGKPERWMQTWYNDFMRAAGPGWSYKVWTMDSLKGEEYFCANLYRDDRAMDAESLQLLALEILFRHGGFYVPLTVLYEGNGSVDFFENGSGFLQKGGVTGSVPNSRKALQMIKAVYNGQDVRANMVVGKQVDPPLVAMGYSDATASYNHFPQWTRYLGAESICDMTETRQMEQGMLSWAYDSQVLTYKLRKSQAEMIPESRCIVVLDGGLARFSSLKNAIPGLIGEATEMDPNWEAMIFGVEWEAGVDEITTYRVTMPVAPPNGMFFGVIFNHGCGHLMPRNVDSVVEELLARHERVKLYVGVQKFQFNRDLSQIFMSVPHVQHAFTTLAGHETPMDYDNHEVHGKLLKGFRDGRLAIEMQADNDNRVMYRAWNDDGGLNCEMKLQMGTSGDVVEWARVYFAHAVVFDCNNKRVPF